MLRVDKTPSSPFPLHKTLSTDVNRPITTATDNKTDTKFVANDTAKQLKIKNQVGNTLWDRILEKVITTIYPSLNRFSGWLNNIFNPKEISNSETVPQIDQINLILSEDTRDSQLKELKKLAEDVQAINCIDQIAEWDLNTKMPEKALESRGWQRAYLKKLQHEILTSNEMKSLISAFTNETTLNQLNNTDKALVKELTKLQKRIEKVPVSLLQELTRVTTEAHQKWLEAREKNDFQTFAPSLEKIILLKKKEAELVGYTGSPYNTLLEVFEPGMTTDILDKLFLNLRNSLAPVIEKSNNEEKEIKDVFSNKNFSIDKQMEFYRLLLEHIGFDFSKGRLDEAKTPFSMGITPNDTRLTINPIEDNLLWGILTMIHEGGHGLLDQGLDPALTRTPLFDAASLGFHESQAKLYDTIIAKGLPFWQYLYPKLQEIFPEQLKNVSLEQFYNALNKVKTTPSRFESDDLSYNLHNMIRYEIEKELIEGKLEVKDIPKSWNQKSISYLGVAPDSDSEGPLEDPHWSCGDIGYFPTYSLGILYAAQIYNTAKKEIPNLEDKIKNGDLITLRDWLKEKIYKHGKTKSPSELIKEVTGEELNINHFVNYITSAIQVSKLHSLKKS